MMWGSEIKIIGLISSIIILVIYVIIWVLHNSNNNYYQIIEEDDSYYGKNLGIDSISLYMVGVTIILIPICILSTWGKIKENEKLYIILWLGLEIVLILVFVVLDILLFYIIFETSLIPMYLIIGVYGTRQRKIYAAYQFFLMTLWGSLLMLMGIIVLYSQTGVTDYQILSISDISKEREYIVWLGLFISFAVKTPLVPVHLWLPEAHSEANIAGSIILAGKKYACYKFNYLLETPKALSTYLYLKLISENLNGCNNGQSAGNYPLIRSQIMTIVNIIGLNIDSWKDQLSNIKLSRILRGYTLKFRYNSLKLKRLNSTGIYPSSNGLSSYLAGLIEGDGCIYIAKNNKNASQIQISFNSKDLPLALIIQKNLWLCI